MAGVKIRCHDDYRVLGLKQNLSKSHLRRGSAPEHRLCGSLIFISVSSVFGDHSATTDMQYLVFLPF